MRLYELSKSISENYISETKIKVEYFWHFWDFVFTENRDLILVDEPKLISHISLINKVEKHLEWNNGINSKKLAKYFNQHPYFNRDNLILRTDRDVKASVNRIKKRIDEFSNCKNNRTELLNCIEKIKEDFFNVNNLSNILVNKLLKIFLNDKSLTKSIKQDLKFLCNSIIDLLRLRGYSLEFIKGLLSNTILNSNNKFSNHNNSKKSEKLTLETRVNHLKELLLKDKQKGYFIFKVDGVDFRNDPIDVFGVKFYNPQKKSFLNFFKNKDSVQFENEYRYFSRSELFNSENEIFNKLTSNYSSCNLIVPVDYFLEDLDYFDSFKYPTKSFLESYLKARISTLEFKRVIKSYNTSSYHEDALYSIKLSKRCILVDADYNYHKSSNDYFLDNVLFEVDSIREKMLNENLSYKSGLNSQNIYLTHLANSNSLLSWYRVQQYDINFKTLWIECMEPYFYDLDEFIRYAKKSIKIRTNLLSKYRLLLTNTLNYSLHIGGSSSYYLQKEKIDEIGITKLEIGEKITGDKLEHNFNKLPEFSILSELKSELNEFVTDPDNLEKKIDLWIENIINSAYDERNIEVHYNLIDYYDNISLKKDFTFIVSCIIGAFNDAIFLHNFKSLKESKDYIDEKYKSIISLF